MGIRQVYMAAVYTYTLSFCETMKKDKICQDGQAK
jgi:hypothetical protein